MEHRAKPVAIARGLALALGLLCLSLSCNGSESEPSRPIAAPASPGCRIDSVTLKDIARSRGSLISCKRSDYAAACNDAVTAQDDACNTECTAYKKRSGAAPTDPDTDAGTCGPNPVRTSIAAFDPKEHCADESGNPGRKVVTCTVSATCTCDP